ncbi:MAG TPA: alpha/beta hydrolase [Xanthobacteraceae bacterium]|nr:alpha/beta hydrolase [Xanthobacteraceae bacterium]
MRVRAQESVEFAGATGNRLVADRYGANGPAALLLHGGGQTRHSWGRTAESLAAAGWVAYALDQRGHGDSEWIAGGAYAFEDFAADAAAVAESLAERHGSKPVAVGASLGGIASLLAEGEAARCGRAPVFSALVLVDVTPRVDPQGVSKIQSFMRAHAREGFATVEEAAEAVARYLPHRPRPRSTAGLQKNLRRHADGRWRWHWDPKFLDGPRSVAGRREAVEQALVAAARSLALPTLLVRGGASELVSEEHAREFLSLVPHAAYADVAGARHMVAGDRNDHFTAEILSFLSGAAGAARAMTPAEEYGRLLHQADRK